MKRPCTIDFLDNSHISEPALELHSRAALSVGGITAQSVQPQGEIQEEGRTEKKIILPRPAGTKQCCILEVFTQVWIGGGRFKLFLRFVLHRN